MTKINTTKLYYIALSRQDKLIYIYRYSKPTLNGYMMYNNEIWTITGYTETTI